MLCTLFSFLCFDVESIVLTDDGPIVFLFRLNHFNVKLLATGATPKVITVSLPDEVPLNFLHIRDGHQAIVPIHVDSAEHLWPPHPLQHVRVGSGITLDMGQLDGSGAHCRSRLRVFMSLLSFCKIFDASAVLYRDITLWQSWRMSEDHTGNWGSTQRIITESAAIPAEYSGRP
jgi:hypothetical protein